MGDDHEGLLADVSHGVMQKQEYILCPFVHEVWKSVEEVCQTDDDVCFDPEFDVGCDKFKDQVKIVLADRGRNAHELA